MFDGDVGGGYAADGVDEERLSVEGDERFGRGPSLPEEPAALACHWHHYMEWTHDGWCVDGCKGSRERPENGIGKAKKCGLQRGNGGVDKYC